MGPNVAYEDAVAWLTSYRDRYDRYLRLIREHQAALSSGNESLLEPPRAELKDLAQQMRDDLDRTDAMHRYIHGVCLDPQRRTKLRHLVRDVATRAAAVHREAEGFNRSVRGTTATPILAQGSRIPPRIQPASKDNRRPPLALVS
jgi:hypothetical protein